MKIEVAFALPYEQKVIELDVEEGVTVAQAIEASDLQQRFPDWNLADCEVGIYAEKVLKPSSKVLEEGDRVEIYRPLQIDPKAARRERAAKASQK